MDKVNMIIDEFLKNDKGNFNILGKLIMVVLVLLAINLINRLAKKIIDKTLVDKNTSLIGSIKRANTLALVLKRIVYYFLVFIGLMIILDLFSVPTASILATAGIGGLAIGFGAQSLVKDIITGFFILLEDQYSVGDLIETEGYEGVVEELGLRVTKLRSFSGDLNIIPNSNIQVVVNKTRGDMRALVRVTIAYEEDIDRAMEVLQLACNQLKDTNKSIVSGPTVLGVSELGDHGFILNIVAKTVPMEQWAVERQIRKLAIEALEREGIEIPYPRTVIIGGKES